MYCKLAIISRPISTHTVLNLFFSSFIIHYQDDLWDWELGTGDWELGTGDWDKILDFRLEFMKYNPKSKIQNPKLYHQSPIYDISRIFIYLAV
jgi:hypothetical protein